MTTTIRRVGAVTMAAMLLVTLGAGLVIGAPTVDTSGTDATTSQSGVTDGHEVSNFNASDENISTLQVNYSSDDPGIQIIDPDTGEVIKEVTNKSNSGYFTEVNTANNHYNTTFQESDFAAVPMDAGENKSVRLSIMNNSTLDSPARTNITIYLNNTNERAVVFAGDQAEAGNAPTTSLDVENDSTWGGFGDEIEQATVEHDNLGISGTDTTIYVVYEEANASDAFNAATDRKLWGSYSDGDFVAYYQLRLEGQKHAVFLNEAPDSVTDGATYAHTTTVDGHDAVAVTVGDHYEDDTSLDVESRANDDYGTLASAFIRHDAMGWNAFSPMSVSGVGSGQLVA